MSRLPAFVDLLGRHHPRGAMGVENYARVLRKGKKIAPSKRGVGAAHLSESDASNLLFGLAELNNASYAAAAVDMLRGALLVGQSDSHPDPLSVLAEYEMELEFRTLGSLLDSVLLQLAKSPLPAKKSSDGYLQSIDLRMQNPTILGGQAFVTFTTSDQNKVVLEYFYEHPELSMQGVKDIDAYMERLRQFDDHDQAPRGISLDINISYLVLWEVAKCVVAER